MLTVPFNTRPLTEPVDGSAVRSSVRRMRPHYPADLYPGGQWRAMVVPLILLLSSVGVLGWGFLWLTDGHVAAIGGWIALVWVLIPGAVAIAIAVARHRLGLRWYRLQAFADANSLQFAPHVDASRWRRSGSPFAVGQARVDAVNVVSSPGTRNLLVGTLRVERGTGKNRDVRVTEFITLSLNRHLPHIVLDAKRNNGLGWNGRLGAEFDRKQRLSLEGNFNDDFTLYCPAGYEADALYLFTPDIMVRMQDYAADWDVEIIDDELYLYAPKPNLAADPKRWQALGATVTALTEKLDQWERWSESRDTGSPGGMGSVGWSGGASSAGHAGAAGYARGPGGRETQYDRERGFVAYEGRRLKARFPWWMWIVIPASLTFAAFGLVQLGIDITVAIGDLWRWLFG